MQNSNDITQETRIVVLLNRLRQALDSPIENRRLLGEATHHAQQILDFFQMVSCTLVLASSVNFEYYPQLLDTGRLEASFQRKVIVTMKRLSGKTDVYPRRFLLSGIQVIGERPVDRGGFSDIRHGQFQGETVCLKVLRTYQQDEVEYQLKVRT